MLDFFLTSGIASQYHCHKIDQGATHIHRNSSLGYGNLIFRDGHCVITLCYNESVMEFYYFLLMDGAEHSSRTSLLSKIKREERIFFLSSALQVPEKNYKEKKNNSQRKKTKSHTTSTYEAFQDWNADGNYVHDDRRSSSQGVMTIGTLGGGGLVDGLRGAVKVIFFPRNLLSQCMRVKN